MIEEAWPTKFRFLQTHTDTQTHTHVTQFPSNSVCGQHRRRHNHREYAVHYPYQNKNKIKVYALYNLDTEHTGMRALRVPKCENLVWILFSRVFGDSWPRKKNILLHRLSSLAHALAFYLDRVTFPRIPQKYSTSPLLEKSASRAIAQHNTTHTVYNTAHKQSWKPKKPLTPPLYIESNFENKNTTSLWVLRGVCAMCLLCTILLQGG